VRTLGFLVWYEMHKKANDQDMAYVGHAMHPFSSSPDQVLCNVTVSEKDKRFYCRKFE